MGRKIIISFFVFIVSGLLVQGQQAYVSGTAHGAEGKVIKVCTYADYISSRELCLASTLIDTAGNFSLSVPLKETSYCWFQIEYYAGEMYLDPGSHHHFTLKGLEFNDNTDRINTNLEQLTINVVPDSGDRLNTTLRQFNIMTNKLLVEHMRTINTRDFRKSADSLHVVCDTLFAHTGMSFITDYIRYRFAYLEWMNLQNSSTEMMIKYIFHQAVLYSNIEYMGFFTQYFDDYFTALNRPFREEHLRKLINTDASYTAILDSMGADTLLRNEVLRGVVLLEELKTAYATNGFKRSSIIRILNEAAANGRFKEQREIAKNLVYTLTRYQSGKPAPDFALPDSWGDTIRLSSYRNKIVYLHFFTTWNTSSLEEMQMMRKLYEKYSGNVQFISICCDRQYMKLYHFARENIYPWPMLHFNNDYDLLESFGVKTYPYFILIDEQGNFLTNPSESPSGNIEARFLNVLKGGK